jgi:serine/threonine-protein kinase HipA
MVKKVSTIEVYFEDQQVGRLALAPDRRCLFEYEAGWIKNGFSISPFYLPLKTGVFTARMEPFDGLFGVFNDSLPDGWGKLLIDRWLISMGYNTAEFNIIDRLSLVC